MLRRIALISVFLAAAAACAKKPETPKEKPATATPARAAAPAAPAPAAATAGPLAARALDGPHPSLDAWCESLKKGGKAPKKCSLDEEGKPALERAAPPWLAAKTIQSGRFDDRQLRVAVQTTAGWFVSRPSAEAVPIIATVGITAREVVAGGGPELVVRYVEVGALADGTGDGRWTQTCTERLVVCGMLDGDRPGCTAPLALREGGCKDATNASWDWELDVQFSGDGRARVAPARGAAPTSAKVLIGTHALGLR